MSEEFLTAQQRARKAFTTLIAGDDAGIDLAHAALLIAAEEYPALDIDRQIAHLDELAVQVRLHLELTTETVSIPPNTTQEYLDILHAINAVLFKQVHFRGNRADYYNPANSFLNKVLETHQGIPITLSLIYLEVGKRLGLHIEGIGMPFHFIVRCTLPTDSIYIDPYEKGRLLSAEECQQRIAHIFKDEKDFDPRWLKPISHKQFLVRILTNLKHIYIHHSDFQRALTACDRILLLYPRLSHELRDRGVVHFHLKYYARALRDLNAYLELAPQANDLAEVEQQIRVIHQLISMMN